MTVVEPPYVINRLRRIHFPLGCSHRSFAALPNTSVTQCFPKSIRDGSCPSSTIVHCTNLKERRPC
jgi:hypothetical protein